MRQVYAHSLERLVTPSVLDHPLDVVHIRLLHKRMLDIVVVRDVERCRPVRQTILEYRNRRIVEGAVPQPVARHLAARISHANPVDQRKERKPLVVELLENALHKVFCVFTGIVYPIDALDDTEIPHAGIDKRILPAVFHDSGKPFKNPVE